MNVSLLKWRRALDLMEYSHTGYEHSTRKQMIRGLLIIWNGCTWRRPMTWGGTIPSKIYGWGTENYFCDWDHNSDNLALETGQMWSEVRETCCILGVMGRGREVRPSLGLRVPGPLVNNCQPDRPFLHLLPVFPLQIKCVQRSELDLFQPQPLVYSSIKAVAGQLVCNIFWSSWSVHMI